MTIELYKTPDDVAASGHPESPISNPDGTLPDHEPALDLGDLLGSFDSREDALAYIREQVSSRGAEVIDSQASPYDAYTHIEWLTVLVQQPDASTQNESYYLVTDEGY